MPDSGFVFSPAFRVVTDEIAAAAGGSIEFYAAGTSTPKVVYSTADLTTTSLGSTVYLDSGGHPVASQGSSTKVVIYTGAAAIKMVVKDADGVTLATYDNVQCAQEVGDGTGAGFEMPVDELAVTSYIADSDDYGRLKEIDITGGSCTFVMPSASDAGTGQIIGVKRKGGSNSLTVIPTGDDEIAAAGSFALSADGDVAIFVSNGSDEWKLMASARPALAAGAITSDLLDARIVGGLAQVGDIKMVAMETVPTGWFECNGAAISRTTNAELYAVIGTTWGYGDNATTFNLPDFRGFVPRGWDHAAGRDPNTAALSVTGAANNGSGAIRLTVASTATLSTGMTVTVKNVGGVSNATGKWSITVVSSTTLDLVGSTWSGTYTSGGTIDARYALNTGGAVGDRVGSYEDDAIQSHTHSYTAPGGTSAGSGVNSVGTSGSTTQTGSSGTTGRFSTETRMKNAFVMFIILADAAAAAGAGSSLNTIYPTTGTPSDSVGVDGDYAVDSAASNWYGPKASGTWPAAISLKGSGPTATSTTSLAIGTGSKTFTTQANRSLLVGDRIRAKSAANPTHWMEGYITSYSGTSLIVDMDLVGDSGTHTDWNISLTGEPGDVTVELTALADAAAASASAAATSETNAETAATNAASSASAASTAATNAANSATAASTSASNASTSATNAAGSASSASSSAGTASTAATNASTSATAAAGSATAAATSATAAAGSQTAAAASATAAASAAAGVRGTSSSSVAIGTGTKTLTTQAGKQWSVGQPLIVMSDADEENYMFGTVTSYSSTTLEVDVTAVGGSGTYADWVINLSGLRGIQGPAGSLDVGALSGVTPASDDKIVIGDTSNANATAYILPSALPISSATQTALDAKLAASSNLSDVASAATAFGNIKQAATESTTGVVELATTSEATTGTDTTRVVTPAGLKAHVDAAVSDLRNGVSSSLDTLSEIATALTTKQDLIGTIAGIAKGNGANALTAATAGTDYMKPDTTSTISKGFTLTPNNIGTVSSGTTTPDPANGNYQYYTNNGAHTLAAPASDCAIDILVTNGASAGSITFSGFTVGSSTGSALTTTNTNKFVISIRRVNSVATYSIYALQ